jgi:hypothetical protein
MRDSHRRAAELHDLAAHAHRAAAERHGKQDHLTGHEHSRQALEHSQQAHQMSLQAHENTSAQPPNRGGHQQIGFCLTVFGQVTMGRRPEKTRAAKQASPKARHLPGWPPPPIQAASPSVR